MTQTDTTGDADLESVSLDDLEVSDDDVSAAFADVAEVTPADATPATATRDFDPSDPDEERPPLDVVFDVLQNKRRRYVLTGLAAASDGETTLKQLADDLAAESDGTRNSVYSALYQSHVPKLADAGAIDYDRRSGVLERGPLFQDYLDALKRVAGGRWELLRQAFPTR